MNIFWCFDFRVNVASRERWDQSDQEVGQWVYFLLHHTVSYREMYHFYNILSFSPGWERSERSWWACRHARCEGELSKTTVWLNPPLYQYNIHGWSFLVTEQNLELQMTYTNVEIDEGQMTDEENSWQIRHMKMDSNRNSKDNMSRVLSQTWCGSPVLLHSHAHISEVYKAVGCPLVILGFV